VKSGEKRDILEIDLELEPNEVQAQVLTDVKMEPITENEWEMPEALIVYLKTKDKLEEYRNKSIKIENETDIGHIVQEMLTKLVEEVVGKETRDHSGCL